MAPSRFTDSQPLGTSAAEVRAETKEQTHDPLADPKPTPDHVVAYSGRELDDALYFYRHRHFDPTVGRWLDREPIGCEADDAVLHRYVGNEPQ